MFIMKNNASFKKSGVDRRRLLQCAGLAMALPKVAWAGSAAPAAPSWRLLVNEAVTGDSNIFLLTARYRPLADFIGTQFKGRAVSVEPVVDIERFVSLAQAT